MKIVYLLVVFSETYCICVLPGLLVPTWLLGRYHTRPAHVEQTYGQNIIRYALCAICNIFKVFNFFHKKYIGQSGDSETQDIGTKKEEDLFT